MPFCVYNVVRVVTRYIGLDNFGSFGISALFLLRSFCPEGGEDGIRPKASKNILIYNRKFFVS